MDYTELSPMAKLNVDADTQATSHREEAILAPIRYTPHLKTSQISICINGTRFYSNISNNLWYHVNGTYLHQYTQQKHSWTDKTWNNIDWKSFGTHFKSLEPQHEVKHTKVVHNQQPLGEKQVKMSSLLDPNISNCPCCITTTEIQRHLLICTHNPAWKSSLQQILKKLRQQQHSSLTVQASGLEQWLTSPDTKPILTNLTAYPLRHQTYIRAAFNSQDQIGWHQAIQGYLSFDWKYAAMIPISSLNSPLDTDATATKFLCHTLKTLHKFTSAIWLGRNEIKHKEKDSALSNIYSKESAEIRYFHQNAHLLRPRERHYTNTPLDTILTSSPATRQRWILRVKKSRAAVLTSDGTHQPTITKFFPNSQQTLTRPVEHLPIQIQSQPLATSVSTSHPLSPPRHSSTPSYRQTAPTVPSQSTSISDPVTPENKLPP